MGCALGPLLQTKTLVGDELADLPSIPISQLLRKAVIKSEFGPVVVS